MIAILGLDCYTIPIAQQCVQEGQQLLLVDYQLVSDQSGFSGSVHFLVDLIGAALQSTHPVYLFGHHSEIPFELAIKITEFVISEQYRSDNDGLIEQLQQSRIRVICQPNC